MVAGQMHNGLTQPPPASSAARHIRVVVVDDSAPARTLLARLLAPYLQIRIAGQAESGPEGLALAASLQPDLLITDLQMPGVDGLQLVRRLRQKYPAMRSLITSVYDSPACHAASLRHGADAFIPKHRLLAEFPRLLSTLFPDAQEPIIPPCME